MLAYAGDVLLRETRPVFGVHRLVPFHEGLETHLGVHYHFASVGVVHDYVGYHGAAVIALDLVAELVDYNSLDVEIHPFLEAALAEQVHQQHLSEIALCLALAGDRIGKRLGLAAYVPALLAEQVYHLLHGAAALRVLLVGSLYAVAEFLEFFLYWFEKFPDALRTGLSEVLAVLCTQRLEGVAHFLQTLGSMLALRLP